MINSRSAPAPLELLKQRITVKLSLPRAHAQGLVVSRHQENRQISTCRLLSKSSARNRIKLVEIVEKLF